MHAYLGVLDRAPFNVQQRKYNAVKALVMKVASKYNMNAQDVWDQTEAAVRQQGIKKLMPGKDY
jgi:hypothetical protein